MASHLNAHNMPGPDVGEDGSTTATRKVWVWVLVGVLVFVGLDRGSLFLIPEQYRSVPDLDHYHTLYYSLKFQRFEKVKDQVETIILGDSRARHGVDPMLFAGQSTESDVTAFNFAPASSGVGFTDFLVREYLCDLDNVQTIVWGVSPRIFNRYWQDPVFKLFEESQGHHSDRLAAEKGFSRAGIKAGVKLGTHRMMSKLSAAFAHRSKLKSVLLDGLAGANAQKHFHEEAAIGISEWGFMEFPESQMIDLTNTDEVERILASLESGRFKLAPGRLDKFRELVTFLEQRRIRLVCFVPPMHHSLMRSSAADADGMPNADYDKLISTLKGFEGEFGNYHFIDFHKGGDNGFSDSEYGDFDHLNHDGSLRFSRTVAEHLKRICAEPLRQVQLPADPGQEAVSDNEDGTLPSTGNGNQVSTVSTDGDNEPPEIVSHVPRGDDYMIAAFPPDNRPLIWAEYEDEGSGIDVKSVRFFMDDKDLTEKCKVTDGKVSFKPAKTLKSPEYYEFKVIVSDKAGNESELVWTLLLKPC
jgi:hypothetical protein